MKIVRRDNVKPVAFGDLDVGIVFTHVDSPDCFFMSCCDVKDCEFLCDEEVLNAVCLDDDNESGNLVHFDDTDMVIPYYNCTLKVG